MSNKQAGKLIIENIQMIDEAVKLLSGDLSQQIFEEIEKVLQDKLSEFSEEWSQSNELFSSGVCLFAPNKWRLIDSEQFNHKDYFARYRFIWQNILSEQETNQYLLTVFFNNSYDVMVFKFVPWFNCYARCTKGLWKKFASIQNEKYPEIESLGFKYSAKEGEWYLPIASLNQQLVADCYVEDNLVDAMGPITEALDKLYQAHPYFDKIVAAAKAEFGVNAQD